MDRALKASVWVLIFLLGACSSAEKKADSQSANSNVAVKSIEPVPTEISGQRELTPTTTTQAIPQVSAKKELNPDEALTEAIRKANPDAIYSTAVRVLTEDAKNLKALNALGVYHLQKGQTKAAKLFFDKSLKISKNQTELYNNLGIVALAENDRPASIKFFKKALEYNRDNGVAANNLGNIYLEVKDFNKALSFLNLAEKSFRNDHRFWNNLGVALVGTRNFDKAKAAFETGLRLRSSDLDLMFNYSILLIQNLKSYQPGLEFLNQLKEKGPRPEMRDKINTLENLAKTGLK